MAPRTNAAPNPALFQSKPSSLETTGIGVEVVVVKGTAHAPISPSFSRMIACCDFWPSPWRHPEAVGGFATWTQGAGSDGITDVHVVRR